MKNYIILTTILIGICLSVVNSNQKVKSKMQDEIISNFMIHNNYKYPSQVQDLPIDQDSFLIEHYIKLSTAHFQFPENDSSRIYLDRALILAQEKKDIMLEGRVLANFGTYFFWTESLFDAIDYLNRAEKKSTEINDLETLSYIYTNSSLVWKYLSDAEKYLEYFNKSIKLNTKIGRESSNIILLATMAEYYFNKGELEKARQKAEDLININADIEKVYWEMKKIILYSDILMELNDIKNAEYSLDSLKSTIDTTVYGENIRDYYKSLTNLNYKKGNYQKALSYLFYTRSINVYFHDIVLLDLDFLEAAILHKLGRNKEALSFLNRINPNILDISQTYMKIKINQLYSDIYKDLENNKLSKEYSDKVNAINDTLTAYGKSQKTDLYELKINLKQKELENEYLQKVKEIESEDYQKSILLIISIGILILLVLMLLLNKVNQKKKINSYEKKLAQQERDKLQVILKEREVKLVEQTKEISDQIEKVALLQDKLQNINSNNSDKESLNKVIENLKLDQNNKNYWLKFETKFLEIYPEFFNILKQKYPELSPSELKVLSFVRMNFNSKEIANILGLEPPSIDRHRSNSRKKMGLAKNIDLLSFLVNLKQ